MTKWKKVSNVQRKLYIPILRGLRPIQKDEQGEKFNNEDSFLKRTTYDYFKNLPTYCKMEPEDLDWVAQLTRVW